MFTKKKSLLTSFFWCAYLPTCRCVRTIERLQLSMLEVRNNMQLSNTKFEEQRLQLVQEKAAVQEQVRVCFKMIYSK